MSEFERGRHDLTGATIHRLAGAPRLRVIAPVAEPDIVGAARPFWRSTEFVWGVVAGTYLGCMVTVIGAYLWGLYL